MTPYTGVVSPLVALVVLHRLTPYTGVVSPLVALVVLHRYNVYHAHLMPSREGVGWCFLASPFIYRRRERSKIIYHGRRFLRLFVFKVPFVKACVHTNIWLLVSNSTFNIFGYVLVNNYLIKFEQSEFPRFRNSPIS